MKYRKKVLVEAEKFDGTLGMMAEYEITIDTTGPGGKIFCINTVSGPQWFDEGDYIIKNPSGDTYPCPAAEFESTYEEAE